MLLAGSGVATAGEQNVLYSVAVQNASCVKFDWLSVSFAIRLR